MGPTVAIWLPREQDALASTQLLPIARLLDSSAETTIDLTVRSTEAIGGRSQDESGRAFGFNLGDTGFEQEEEERRSIEEALGYVPSSAIHIFAFSNSPIDHRMLAEIALYFARTFGGLIDFGGNLGEVRRHAGQLFSIPYCAGSTPQAFHVGDIEFLENWLADPRFHMVK